MTALAWAAPAPALTNFADSGADVASITDTVNNFRAALGDPNNANNPGPLPSGGAKSPLGPLVLRQEG